MKILLINERIDLAGGSERYTSDIAYGLSGLGQEVEVIYGYGEAPQMPAPTERPRGDSEKTEIPQGELSPESKKEGPPIRYIFIEELKIKAVTEAVVIFNPDVINVQNINDSNLLEALNRIRPTVRFIHDHSSYCPGNSKMWFSTNQVCPVATSWRCGFYAFKEKCMTRHPLKLPVRIGQRQKMMRALKQLPKVFCNSRYLRDQLLQNGLGVNSVSVNPLFPGGFSSGELPPIREELTEVPEVLFVGRVFLEKGVDYLLRAAALIGDVPLIVRIIGGGWDLKRCQDLASDLRINNKVVFTGPLPREQIDYFYRRCRLLVVPSVWPEPFGMVGLEAYRFGKPVIAFNTGGISDWLIDNQTGFLLPRGDINLLAQKIRLLLTNTVLAKRLGEAGRQLVSTAFTRERHLRQLMDTYRSLTPKVG